MAKKTRKPNGSGKPKAKKVKKVENVDNGDIANRNILGTIAAFDTYGRPPCALPETPCLLIFGECWFFVEDQEIWRSSISKRRPSR